MSDCIDILRSIGATCSSLNQIGGVNKRLWVIKKSQIESYTFDLDGYVNEIVTKWVGSTNTRYPLATITGKKNTHSGNYEAVSGENINVINQTAVIKIYEDSPVSREKIIELFNQLDVVVFFETENETIEIYGLEHGLEGSNLTGGTGVELQDDKSVIVTLSGTQSNLPYLFKHGSDIYSSIEYLNGIGNEATIANYTAGISMFDFAPDGANGWDATFLAEPISVQSLSGATVNDCEYGFNFWSAKTKTNLFHGNTGTDVSFNTGALGAGVYELIAKYTLTDGSSFRVRGLYKVDSTDTIIASVLMGGVTVNSVSGLSMNVTANIEQVGCSYTPYWEAFDIFDNGTEVGTGITADLALPIGTIFIGCLIDLDSIFSDDYDGDNAIDFTVSIS